MTSHGDETRQVLEEHRQLRKELAELERLTAATPSAEARGAWLDDLSRRIGSLRPDLEAHFDLETRSGFFEDIERAWPNAAAQCVTFLRDHRRYLDRLDAVLGSLAARPAADGAVTALAAEVRSIVTELHRHETRENELFLTALEGGPAPLD